MLFKLFYVLKLKVKYSIYIKKKNIKYLREKYRDFKQAIKPITFLQKFLKFSKLFLRILK